MRTLDIFKLLEDVLHEAFGRDLGRRERLGGGSAGAAELGVGVDAHGGGVAGGWGVLGDGGGGFVVRGCSGGGDDGDDWRFRPWRDG